MQYCVLVAKGLAAHERPPHQEEGYDVCAELSEGAAISGASPDQRDRSVSAAISDSGSFREKPNELETAEEKLSRSGEEKGHQRSRSLGESKKVKCKCMLFPVFTNLCLMGSRRVMPIGQGQLPYACPFPLLPFVITQGTKTYDKTPVVRQLTHS